MPRASGQKYHYRDHDTDEVNEAPPVQDEWYEVFHAQDVRHLWCVTAQTNDEAAAKDIEVRWTIDGNVYFATVSHPSATEYWVNRNHYPSGLGTGGLSFSDSVLLASFYAAKKGLDYKVEVRMTSVPGTNQTLICRCVRETLVLT